MSMEEALATGLIHCPSHKVHNDSAHLCQCRSYIHTHLLKLNFIAFIVSLSACVIFRLDYLRHMKQHI